MKISKELKEIIRQTIIQEAGEACAQYAGACEGFGNDTPADLKKAKDEALKQVLTVGNKLLKLHRGSTPRIEI